MNKNTDVGILILRIAIALLMALYGFQKLKLGTGLVEQQLLAKGFPSFFAYGAYLGELIAPVMLILGWRTRIAAILFSGNCIVAILLFFPDQIFTLNAFGGWGVELLGLYLFCAVVLWFTGGGKYALSTSSSWD